MRQSVRLTTGLDKVLSWINWIVSASRRMSFALPPKELLVFFVVQSVERAHSLNAILDERLPVETVDEHIRSYLLDRVWSYRLISELVLEDVREFKSRIAHVESTRLVNMCRKMVARVMLQPEVPDDSARVRTLARRAVLCRLKISHASLGHSWARPTNVVPLARRQSPAICD